jgi:hypothetical protein
VRLDLIRPHLLSAPQDEADEAAPLVTQAQSPEAAAEEAKAEARAPCGGARVLPLFGWRTYQAWLVGMMNSSAISTCCGAWSA